jgi:hypothetical protein
VVLHVTGRQVIDVLAFEFGEQVSRHLAQRVHQNVQTSAVSHADDDFLHAGSARVAHDFVHRRNEALAAFQRKALLADVLRVQKTLEPFRRRQALKNVLFLVGGEIRGGADRFELLFPPALLFRIADVHELGADRAAVRVTQCLHDFTQRSLFETEIQVLCMEHLIHVRFSEVVERGFELRNGRALAALQRIEVGPLGAEETVSANQRLDIDLLARGRQITTALARHEAVRFRALRERFDDRAVGHVVVIRPIRCRHVLQRIEIGTPGLGH